MTQERLRRFLVLMVALSCGSLVRIAAELALGRPTRRVEYLDSRHPHPPSLSPAAVGNGGDGHRKSSDENPRSGARRDGIASAPFDAGSEAMGSRLGSAIESPVDRAIRAAYEEAGMETAYARAFGPHRVVPIGMSLYEMEGTKSGRGDGEEMAEAYSSVYQREGKVNERVPGMRTVAASLFRDQVLAFRTGERLEVLTGVDSSRWSAERLARVYVERAGRRFEELTSSDRDRAIRGAQQVCDALESCRRELWEVAWRALAADEGNHRTMEPVSAFMVRGGKAYVIRRGADAELEHLLDSAEGDNSRMKAALRDSLSR